MSPLPNCFLWLCHPALQHLAKLLNRQSGVLHNPAQRNSLERIVPRNRHLTDAIGHDDVLALADDRKPRFFQSPNRIQVIDPHNLGHS